MLAVVWRGDSSIGHIIDVTLCKTMFILRCTYVRQNLFRFYVSATRAVKWTAFCEISSFGKIQQNITIFSIFVHFIDIFQYFRVDLQLVLSPGS